MLVAIAMFAFVSCKDEGKASQKMEENTTTETTTQNSTDQAAANSDSASDKLPILTFDHNNYDFGTVQEGEIVEHEFTFTNTGEAPLKVMKASPSCGCTVPEWSREAIAPGEKGSLTVKFDARGRTGKQHKNVRLTTNTKNGNEVLTFSATVEK